MKLAGWYKLKFSRLRCYHRAMLQPVLLALLECSHFISYFICLFSYRKSTRFCVHLCIFVVSSLWQAQLIPTRTIHTHYGTNASSLIIVLLLWIIGNVSVQELQVWVDVHSSIETLQQSAVAVSRHVICLVHTEGCSTTKLRLQRFTCYICTRPRTLLSLWWKARYKVSNASYSLRFAPKCALDEQIHHGTLHSPAVPCILC